MSKKNFMSASEVREAFAKSAAATGSATDRKVLRNLSHALAALQQAGVEVSFEPAGWSGSDTFKSISGGTASFSGLLLIGHSAHVLSMLNHKDGTDTLTLAYYNSRLGDIDNRTWSFDVTDENCYVNLQQRIIELAARSQFIADNDVADAFAAPSTRGVAGRVTILKPATTK